MLGQIWDSLLYEPLLNAMAFLVSVVPGGDVGLAIIILTLLVRVALLPLSRKQIRSQTKMNLLTPEVNKIKASDKSKEEQAQEIFALYKKHKTSPFSGCLLIIIQLPIIFALYYVFLRGLSFEGSLYSFIQMPEIINENFLGLIQLTEKSIYLAIIAGITQFFQAHLMPIPPKSESKKGSLSENISNSMRTQMKYVFPFIVVFIAYSISGAVALYWATSNMFAIGQQVYFNKKIKEESQDIKDNE